FIGVAFICFLLLAFQRSSAVQHVKAFFVACISPTQRLFTHMTHPSAPVESSVSNTVPSEASSPSPVEIGSHSEQTRALHVLSDENTRLHNLLDLKKDRWPQMVAAHVVS